MNAQDEVLQTELQFFDALLGGDANTLSRLLADDFQIVDIMAGNVAPKDLFVQAVGAGMLKFTKIERLEAAARLYGQTAIVVGRTRMEGSFQGQQLAVDSRYTHVFVNQGSGWQMANAQGTQIKS